MTRPAAQKRQNWMFAVEGVFIAAAVFIGMGIAQQEFAMAVPLILAMAGFILLRYVLHRPFHEAFTLYMTMAAFNYYYFYCAKLTGRNPTDVGDWGTPATNLEKAQKDIIFILLLGLGLVKLFRNRLEGMPFWSRKLDHPILKLTFCFILFTIFRGFFWVFQGDTTFETLFYLRTNIEFAMIPFLMCTALIAKEKHIRIIFKGMLYSLPVVAILGIVEFLLHGSPYVRSFYGGQEFARAVSTMQNPNNLGGYLVVTTGVYILYFFKNQLNSFERWLFWPTMPLSFACLFMTLSRSSILFFFFTLTGCFAILYFTAQKEMGRERFIICRNLMVAYILTLASCSFILVKYFDFENALTDAVEMYVQSSSMVGNNRLYAPVMSIGTLLENPLNALFGYSKVTYRALSDNVFANVLTRNGVIGFLLYISIWLKAMFESLFGALRARGPRGALYLLCFYIITFQFCYGFSAPVNENFPHNMYLWFAIGTVAWLNSKPAQAQSAPEEPESLPEEGSEASPAA